MPLRLINVNHSFLTQGPVTYSHQCVSDPHTGRCLSHLSVPFIHTCYGATLARRCLSSICHSFSYLQLSFIHTSSLPFFRWHNFSLFSAPHTCHCLTLAPVATIHSHLSLPLQNVHFSLYLSLLVTLTCHCPSLTPVSASCQDQACLHHHLSLAFTDPHSHLSLLTLPCEGQSVTRTIVLCSSDCLSDFPTQSLFTAYQFLSLSFSCYFLSLTPVTVSETCASHSYLLLLLTPLIAETLTTASCHHTCHWPARTPGTSASYSRLSLPPLCACHCLTHTHTPVTAPHF